MPGLLIVFGLLLGCTTTPNFASRITGVDWPHAQIRALIISIIPGGQRAISPNGREILSRHFIVKGNRYAPAGDANQRYYARVLILGDRRPFDIEISVTHEARVERGGRTDYAVVGLDPRLAKELEKSIRAELTKRREDRNIIDDFRVF